MTSLGRYRIEALHASRRLGKHAPIPDNIGDIESKAWQLGLDDFQEEVTRMTPAKKGPGLNDEQLSLSLCHQEVEPIHRNPSPPRILISGIKDTRVFNMASVIDAQQHYVERPHYTASLISQAVEKYQKPSAVAEKVGVTRQYLYYLGEAERTPSYAVQFCMELLTDKHPHIKVEVDATLHFRKQPEFISDLVTSAEQAAGGPVALARRLGVTKQFLNGLKEARRKYRYPMQVLLAAIVYEHTASKKMP